MEIDVIAKTILTVMEPYKALRISIKNNIVPALVSFNQTTKLITESLQYQLEENRPTLFKLIKELTDLAQVYEVAERLGDRQFVLVSHIPQSLVRRFSRGEDLDILAIEYLISDKLINQTAEYCGIQESLLLQQSIQALFDSAYNLAVLGLMACLDKALSEQSGKIKNVHFKARCDAIINRLKEKGELYVDEIKREDFFCS